MSRELAPSDAVALVRLWWFFMRNRFAFVQTHTPKASVLGLPAARLAGTRAIYTMHGALYFRDNGRARNVVGWLFEKWCCAWASQVLLQSVEDRTVIQDVHICRGKKLVYIGNGIDLDRFVDQGPPAESGLPTVTMVSRLVSEKGCRDFFEAARVLRGKARFVHVGPAEPDQSDAISEVEVAAATQEGLVKFVGRVDDVRPYVQQADIVVLPSYREGIPRAAMEAAALARPVVAYNIRGVREVIPMSTGLLVRKGDRAALIAELQRLIPDPALRSTLGQACRDNVVANYGEQKVFARLRLAYSEVLR
jgi:glycosyltransferase involved in cell wall biosynthesis